MQPHPRDSFQIELNLSTWSCDLEEGLKWQPRPLRLASAIDCTGVELQDVDVIPACRFPVFLNFELSCSDSASNLAVKSFDFSEEAGFSDIDGITTVGALRRHLHAEADDSSACTQDDLEAERLDSMAESVEARRRKRQPRIDRVKRSTAYRALRHRHNPAWQFEFGTRRGSGSRNRRLKTPDPADPMPLNEFKKVVGFWEMAIEEEYQHLQHRVQVPTKPCKISLAEALEMDTLRHNEGTSSLEGSKGSKGDLARDVSGRQHHQI